MNELFVYLANIGQSLATPFLELMASHPGKFGN